MGDIVVQPLGFVPAASMITDQNVYSFWAQYIPVELVPRVSAGRLVIGKSWPRQNYVTTILLLLLLLLLLLFIP